MLEGEGISSWLAYIFFPVRCLHIAVDQPNDETFCFFPDEYKSKVACEDDKLRLSCKKNMVIAIYSAVFGRTQGGSLECPYQNLEMPAIECQSATALQLMTRRCHGKRSCSVYASTYEFGDPCYPGVHKHLNVIYTCGIYIKRTLSYRVPHIMLSKTGRHFQLNLKDITLLQITGKLQKNEMWITEEETKSQGGDYKEALI
uniref:SUEL-type lectin domain-containing protein n=1 Tax=Chelonoidis abingdonii TaxID=106734 RepID=A0A8C0GEF9_CHEAB